MCELPGGWFSYLLVVPVINSLCAEFIWRNMKIYFHVLWFLGTYMVQTFKILCHGTQGPVYPMLSITWLLMTWCCKELGHQQSWYLPIFPEYSSLCTTRVTSCDIGQTTWHLLLVLNWSQPCVSFKHLNNIFLWRPWKLNKHGQVIPNLTHSSPGEAYVAQWAGSFIFQVMACHLFYAKPLPEPKLINLD